MASMDVVCPHCGKTDLVVRFGFNRCGTRKYRCKACVKVFTPQPQTRTLTPEKEELIRAALEKQASLWGIARAYRVSRNTITALQAKEGRKTNSTSQNVSS